MAALNFDLESERIINGGIDHGVGYLLDGMVYKGYAWNGLTSWETSNEGADANVIWADNIKYGALRGAESYAGSVTTYTIPEGLYPILGLVSLGDDIYAHEQTHAAFRAAYRERVYTGSAFKGYKYHVLYGLTMGANSFTAETLDDSPDAAEFSWDLDGVPVTVTRVVSSKAVTVTNCEFTFETPGEEFPDIDTRLGQICRLLYGCNAADETTFKTYFTALTGASGDPVVAGGLYSVTDSETSTTKYYVSPMDLGVSGAMAGALLATIPGAEVTFGGCCPEANGLFNIVAQS